MEPAIIGAASGVVVAAITLAGFWMALSDRISKAQAAAESGVQVAAEAEEGLKKAHGRITDLAASFADYREQALEKFVAYKTLAEMEKRMVENQAKSEQRFVDALDGLNKRLDRLIEAGLRSAHS